MLLAASGLQRARQPDSGLVSSRTVKVAPGTVVRCTLCENVLFQTEPGTNSRAADGPTELELADVWMVFWSGCRVWTGPGTFQSCAFVPVWFSSTLNENTTLKSPSPASDTFSVQ